MTTTPEPWPFSWSPPTPAREGADYTLPWVIAALNSVDQFGKLAEEVRKGEFAMTELADVIDVIDEYGRGDMLPW